MVEERVQPHANGIVVNGAAFEMRGARAGAGQLHAGDAARGPPAHHGVGDLRMELDRVSRRTPAEHLDPTGVAFGQQLGPARQIKSLALPVLDMLRPRGAHGAAGAGRPDRVVAARPLPVAVAKDGAAEMARENLRPEADAEERLFLLERRLEPPRLAADER